MLYPGEYHMQRAPELHYLKAKKLPIQICDLDVDLMELQAKILSAQPEEVSFDSRLM